MEINGYPNYLIYNDGRVYSKYYNKLKKSYQCKKGYCRLNLYNGKEKKFLVHRLVALHYIPNPNNYPEVDHIDRNTQNNHVSNLRWCNREMNCNNTNITTNTGEKYIRYIENGIYKYYVICKKKKFRISLNCNKHTLQDAINVRDSLLG
jgi:hypothetical protein